MGWHHAIGRLKCLFTSLLCPFKLVFAAMQQDLSISGSFSKYTTDAKQFSIAFLSEADSVVARGPELHHLRLM